MNTSSASHHRTLKATVKCYPCRQTAAVYTVIEDLSYSPLVVSSCYSLFTNHTHHTRPPGKSAEHPSTWKDLKSRKSTNSLRRAQQSSPTTKPKKYISPFKPSVSPSNHTDRRPTAASPNSINSPSAQQAIPIPGQPSSQQRPRRLVRSLPRSFPAQSTTRTRGSGSSGGMAEGAWSAGGGGAVSLSITLPSLLLVRLWDEDG